MNERINLEFAAKACGLEIFGFYGDDSDPCIYADIGPEDVVEWKPLTDQADSDRMGCKLRIYIEYEGDCVAAWHAALQPIYIQHNNTDEDVCRAVREARMLVAVEIGRLK